MSLAYDIPPGMRDSAIGDPLYTFNEDVLVVLALSMVFTALRYVSEKTVFTWLADHYGAVHQPNRKKNPRKRIAEAGWKLVVWTFLFLLGIYVCHDKPWFFDGPALFANFPHPIQYDVKVYYLIELAWYIHSQIYLMFLEKETGQSRSDFWAMTIHHFTTVALITWSYTRGYTPIGCMIMWVHDVVDIFLESALLLKELKFEKLVDALFGCFALSWVVFRLYIFPFHLVGAVLFDSYSACPSNELSSLPISNAFAHMFAGMNTRPNLCYGIPWFVLLLLTLCSLHVYWFYLIVLMIIKAVQKKGVEGDIRDEKED